MTSLSEEACDFLMDVAESHSKIYRHVWVVSFAITHIRISESFMYLKLYNSYYSANVPPYMQHQ